MYQHGWGPFSTLEETCSYSYLMLFPRNFWWRLDQQQVPCTSLMVVVVWLVNLCQCCIKLQIELLCFAYWFSTSVSCGLVTVYVFIRLPWEICLAKFLVLICCWFETLFRSCKVYSSIARMVYRRTLVV